MPKSKWVRYKDSVLWKLISEYGWVSKDAREWFSEHPVYMRAMCESNETVGIVAAHINESKKEIGDV
jgi:hypothetical protein